MAGAALTLSGCANIAIAGHVSRVKLASFDVTDVSDVEGFTEIGQACCPIGNVILRWRGTDFAISGPAR